MIRVFLMTYISLILVLFVLFRVFCIARISLHHYSFTILSMHSFIFQFISVPVCHGLHALWEKNNNAKIKQNDIGCVSWCASLNADLCYESENFEKFKLMNVFHSVYYKFL